MKPVDWEAERKSMVAHQLQRRGILDPAVLAVMGRMPRELFVPERHRALAYQDAPVSIGFDQTISQPYMTAFMSQALELTGHERVLDVGAGSGYHAAVLGALAARVYAIELIPELAAEAEWNLHQAGAGGNIAVIRGDGSRGYPEAMPYDAISVAAGAPEIPSALVDQLGDAGRLVIPVGAREEQDLLLVTKKDGKTTTRKVALCRFVPLRGREGWRD